MNTQSQQDEALAREAAKTISDWIDQYVVEDRVYALRDKDRDAITRLILAAITKAREQLPRLVHRNGDLGWENADHSVDYIIGLQSHTASIICKAYYDRILSQ